MKRLFAAALAAVASLAFGATTIPPQAINPAGSTAGQAIISTGATTTPVWGAVPLTGITGTLAIANGGTGATTAAAARTNLGVVSSAGGTYTGSLTISASSGAATINDTSGTGASAVYLQSSSVNRWGFVNNSGSSNSFGLNRYVSGTYADTPISVSNSTGVTTFSARPVFGSATPWDNSNLASPASLAGATFTGPVLFSYSNPAVTINDTSSANNANILYQKGGTSVWSVYNNSSSNIFQIGRWVSGSYADSPISISNSTGIVTFADGLVASGLITPTSNIGIKASATNDIAPPGSIGEYASASVTTGTAITLATATNLCTLQLTPGSWMVSGNASYTSGTTITQAITSITTTSATSAGQPYQLQQALNLTSGQVWSASPMETYVKVASTQNVYLVGFVNGTGSPTFQCTLQAIRPR